MQFDSLKIIAAEAEATEAIEVVAEVIDLIPTGTLVDSTTTGLAEAALDTQTMAEGTQIPIFIEASVVSE